MDGSSLLAEPEDKGFTVPESRTVVMAVAQPVMAQAMPVQQGIQQGIQGGQPGAVYAPVGGPIMTMPGGAPGMVVSAPAHVVGISGGQLAHLAGVQGLCIRQKIRLGQLLTDQAYQQANKYKIMIKPPTLDANMPLLDEIASQLPPIFWAVEESDCCERQLCGPMRSFTMNITNAEGVPVLVIERPFKCTILCHGCCVINPQEMIVRTGAGMPIGRIVMEYKTCNFDHWFRIHDGAEQLIYEVHIGLCECWATPRPSCLCKLWTGEILAPDNPVPVAHLQNIFPGCNGRGMCTKADNFQVNYHVEVPVEHKALIFCSMFLIDMVYFERQQK